MRNTIRCECCDRVAASCAEDGAACHICHEGMDRDISNLGTVCGTPVLLCEPCCGKRAPVARCPSHGLPKENR